MLTTKLLTEGVRNRLIREKASATKVLTSSFSSSPAETRSEIMQSDKTLPSRGFTRTSKPCAGSTISTMCGNLRSVASSLRLRVFTRLYGVGPVYAAL